MAIQILSGATNTIWTIDSTSNAGRVTVYDQYGNAMSDISSLANILNALNSAVTIVLGGQATLGINIGGTTGTLTASFEATIDNSTWFALTSTPINGGSTIISTSANGQWLASTSGFYAIRVRISAFTSGSMTVSAIVTPQMSKIVAQAITTAGALSVEITDGSSDGPAAVKPASTAAVATDPSLVVAVSPNNSVAITAASLPLPTSAATSANQTTLGTQTTELNDGTHTATIKATSTQSLATDTALVVALSPGSAQTRSSTATVAGVASSASSVTILAANSARLGAIITNNSTAILYLIYGSGAASIASGGFTVEVAISGGTHEVFAGYTGQINGIWASANGYCQVTSLTV